MSAAVEADTPAPVVHVELFRKIAAEFMGRVSGVPINGKVTQDKAALEFVCGAAAFAEVTGDKVSADCLAKLAWLVSIRGADHLRRLAAGS